MFSIALTNYLNFFDKNEENLRNDISPLVEYITIISDKIMFPDK